MFGFPEKPCLVSLDDALFINIPKTGQEKGKPQVTLKSKQSTGTLTWAGVIDRSEGSIDPQSRLLHLVAQQVQAQLRRVQGSADLVGHVPHEHALDLQRGLHRENTGQLGQ